MAATMLLGLLTVEAQPTQITTLQAKTLYKTVNKKRVSVHDPSVVWEPKTQRYYIFGSHRGVAWSKDLQNWTSVEKGNESNNSGQSFRVGVAWKTATSSNAVSKLAFAKPAVTKVPMGGQEVDFPAFNAYEWSNSSVSGYDISGNLWAPDVIYNPTMEKWCMYMSVNGDSWLSSIVLLTADAIEGPYTYQGPVVISGFRSTSIDYHKTDLELVLGELKALPSRYNHSSTANGQTWGDWWPNNIDPCAFFDEDGELWLIYGSWSGGIWMLKLNKENGLRDYDTTYSSDYSSKGKAMTSDPYFGKRIAGGCYVSGEGPYIEHSGQYYFLFMSYGGFAPDGGYEMRVFRSDKPDGPYKDASGRSALFTDWVLNYGKNSNDTRGEKLMGAYNKWGFMTVGECAQGHNSAIAADDGRSYLVYHTKFNDGTIGHQVRTHQMYLNKQGWLVVAPFEYNGEESTDADVASRQLVSDAEIPGKYQLLIHKYKMDHANMEEVTPVEVELNADGTVSGAYTGTWELETGTSYITLKLGTITYDGVLVEGQMDQQSIKTVTLTAMAKSGVNVWAYKMRGDYSLAWQLNHEKIPVTAGQKISQNIDLYDVDIVADNVTLAWSSSQPDIISDYGRYNPTDLKDDTSVTLTAQMTSGDYFWTQDYNVTALSEENAKSGSEWDTGIVAYYGFDDESLANVINSGEHAELLQNGGTPLPTLADNEPLRNGNCVHLYFAGHDQESYVKIPNPLFGKELNEGASLSFFVKRTDDNVWDALFGVVNGDARLYMTGNLYTGYNNNAGTWIDINHPTVAQPAELSAGTWHFVTVTFSRAVTSSSGGVTVYVDGKRKSNDVFTGKLGDSDISKKQGFDYNYIVDHIAASPYLYLGYGSFWGSPDALIDELFVHDRPLSLTEAGGLRQMANRVFTYTGEPTGISEALTPMENEGKGNEKWYDLSGRCIDQSQPLRKGLYILGGRKVVK